MTEPPEFHVDDFLKALTDADYGARGDEPWVPDEAVDGEFVEARAEAAGGIAEEGTGVSDGLAEAGAEAAGGIAEEGTGVSGNAADGGSLPSRGSRAAGDASAQDVDWPALNSVRAAFRALWEERGTGEAVRQAIEEALAEVEARQALVSSSLDGGIPDAATEAVQVACEGQRAGLLRLLTRVGRGSPLAVAQGERASTGSADPEPRDLASCEPGAVSGALREVQDATNALAEALGRFEAQQQALLVLTCPRCQVRCPDGLLQCPACGLVLQVTDDMGFL